MTEGEWQVFNKNVIDLTELMYKCEAALKDERDIRLNQFIRSFN